MSLFYCYFKGLHHGIKEGISRFFVLNSFGACWSLTSKRRCLRQKIIIFSNLRDELTFEALKNETVTSLPDDLKLEAYFEWPLVPLLYLLSVNGYTVILVCKYLPTVKDYKITQQYLLKGIRSRVIQQVLRPTPGADSSSPLQRKAGTGLNLPFVILNEMPEKFEVETGGPGCLQLTATPATHYYLNPNISEVHHILSVYANFINPTDALDILRQPVNTNKEEKMRNKFSIQSLLNVNPQHYKPGTKKIPEGSSDAHCLDYGPQQRAKYGTVADDDTAMATITCSSHIQERTLPKH
nr:hypothetical protein [Tanacetum cinerariifolium]